MKYKIVLILIFLIFFSCQKEKIKNLEEENMYQIITLLVNDNKKYIVLSPYLPPPPFSKGNIKIQDSLNVYKYFIKQSLKKKTITLENNLFPIEEEYSFRGKCEVSKKLIKKFNTLKENKSFDLEKVTIYGRDSLIKYREEFKKLPRKGFNKIDLALNFSRIAFNENYNKAIIIVGASKGRLNGFSTLLYLEKENYVWQIKCSHGLSIS